MVAMQTSLTLSDLRPGFQFHQYQLLEQIGAGGQGVVWSAEDRQRNDIVAIKFNEVPDSEQEQADDEMFGRQLEKLLSVQHPNILPISDSGLENRVRYLVTPYIAGGSVFERIKRGRLPLEDAFRFSAEIASALDFLHSQGIIHRDIKSSNILLNLKNHTYLADFGLARSLSTTTQAMHTGRGTPVYAPPEQHKLLEITRKSDIYSFGILLFEIFAGQLPLGGETMLGIQQLYSNVEIPDPCEINNTLPPLMKEVLRRVTSADPVHRPSSAADVMKMLYYIFGMQGFSPSIESIADRAVILAQDADDLFNKSLSRWAMGDHDGETGLTKFALIDLDHKLRGEDKTQGGVGQFMLFHALLYGYKDEYWWSKVTNSRDRLAVSFRLLTEQDEAVAARVLDLLVADKNLQALPADQSSKIIASLLEMAARSRNRAFAQKFLSTLRILIPSGSAWNNSSLNPELNKLLGELALEDSDAGDQAAYLAGHLRSQPVVNFILKRADRRRLVPALLEVQHAAGRLPAFVPGEIRLRVTLEWIFQRLTFQPARMFGAYILALLGATLGIATQEYLTYRLPEFIDVLRISTSLEQGLITGIIFSLGIFAARLLVERFSGVNALLRIFLGTVAGAIGMNIAMFIFHVLFIETPPKGFLITLGCIMIAFSFALSGLFRSRLVGMFLSVSAISLAIIGTWWTHLTFAASITELTPLFQYDYGWSFLQILFTSILVALWIGVFGNLMKLTTEET